MDVVICLLKALPVSVNWLQVITNDNLSNCFDTECRGLPGPLYFQKDVINSITSNQVREPIPDSHPLGPFLLEPFPVPKPSFSVPSEKQS